MYSTEIELQILSNQKLQTMIKILIIEDSENDTILLVDTIKKGGFELNYKRVEDHQEMNNALENENWDAVISDCALPHFSVQEALKLLHSHGLDVPFIIVSGVIGEEDAVESLKAGAHDFILKDKLARLVPALKRELNDAETRWKHRQAEQALKKTKEKFQALIENSSDIIQIIDSEGIIRYISPSVQRILGYKPEELIGKTSFDWIHSDDRPAVAEEFQKAFQKPDELRITVCRCKHKDGTWRFLEGTGINRLDLPGVNGFISNIRDVTESKRAEEKLRESEDKYRTIFENTGTATVIVEKDMTISLANNEFEKLSGFKKKEIEGKKSWTEFVVKEDLDRLKERHDLRRKNPAATLKSYEFRFVDKNKKVKNIHLFIDMIPGTDQSVASLQDITERKQAEEALKKKINQIERFNSEICSFVAFYPVG
ncbi:hypothetical protein ES705_13813 [subsurface metagenome]